MSLFIATGSNIGDKLQHLIEAKKILSKHFEFIAESRIYHSKAVGYLNQEDFYNQVLEFKTPSISPDEVMLLLLDIEKDLGRVRNISQGPRTIDLDILFFDDLSIQTKLVKIPHERLFERSFVVLPLSELPGFSALQKKFEFSFKFNNEAFPI